MSAKSYTFTGNKTVNIIPSVPSNTIMENVTFVINYSRPLEKKKSKGSVAFFEYEEGQILDFHLDCIYKVCKNPQIILICGIGADKFYRHKRRSEYTLIENRYYQHFNSSEDFRLGVNASFFNKLIYIDGRLIPNIKTYKIILNNSNVSLCLTYAGNEENTNIGVVKNDYSIITEYTYSSNLKIKGLYYLNTLDLCKMKYKLGSNMPKNYLEYELFKKDFSIFSIKDTSNAILLEDNWTF